MSAKITTALITSMPSTVKSDLHKHVPVYLTYLASEEELNHPVPTLYRFLKQERSLYFADDTDYCPRDNGEACFNCRGKRRLYTHLAALRRLAPELHLRLENNYDWLADDIERFTPEPTDPHRSITVSFGNLPAGLAVQWLTYDYFTATMMFSSPLRTFVDILLTTTLKNWIDFCAEEQAHRVIGDLRQSIINDSLKPT